MLHRICKSGDYSNLEVCLNSLKERESETKLLQLVSSKNEQRYTPLHCAIFQRFSYRSLNFISSNLFLEKKLGHGQAVDSVWCWCEREVLRYTLFASRIGFFASTWMSWVWDGLFCPPFVGSVDKSLCEGILKWVQILLFFS